MNLNKSQQPSEDKIKADLVSDLPNFQQEKIRLLETISRQKRELDVFAISRRARNQSIDTALARLATLECRESDRIGQISELQSAVTALQNVHHHAIQTVTRPGFLSVETLPVSHDPHHIQPQHLRATFPVFMASSISNLTDEPVGLPANIAHGTIYDNFPLF